jgi:hypothetical protein
MQCNVQCDAANDLQLHVAHEELAIMAALFRLGFAQQHTL